MVTVAIMGEGTASQAGREDGHGDSGRGQTDVGDGKGEEAFSPSRKNGKFPSNTQRVLGGGAEGKPQGREYAMRAEEFKAMK